MRIPPALVLVATLASACGAVSNPARPQQPAAWTLGLARGAEADPDASGGPRAEPGAGGEAAPAAAEPASVPGAVAPAQGDVAQGAPPAAAPPPATPATGGLVIATVAGQPIDASALFAQWLHRSSNEVLDELDQLVMERMVALEAARHRVAVEDEDAERAYRAAIDSIEREIARGRPGTTLDEYVERALGLDPDTYRARLQRGARQALVGERVFRAHLLTHPHAWARMIVVRGESEAQALRTQLDQGADFAALAREHSIDGDERERGELVPVLESDTLMSRLVFQTPIGDVAGPTLEQGAYLLVKVEERPAPIAGEWPAVAAAVLASLEQKAVHELEITQWKAAMLRRYEVDLKPFLRLAGEPTPGG